MGFRDLIGAWRNRGALGSVYDLTREPTTTGPLPLVFGTARVEGRYVTLWDRIEPETDAGGTMRTATYTARIALCQGPASGYRRIWIDGKLVPSAANPGQIQGLFSYHNSQSATFIDPATYGDEAHKLSLLAPFADRSFAFIAGDYAEGDWTYQSPRAITGFWEAPVWHPPSEGNAGYYDAPVWNAGTTTPHVWPRNVDTDPRPPLGGVCHLRLTRLQAPASDAPPKVDVEVLGLHRSGLTGDGAPLADDANPCDVLTTLLTSSVYSWDPLLSSSELEVDVGADGTAASSARRYCQAMGFYVSRAIEAYTPILDLVAELLQAMNCIAFWSEGKLKVRPLGDRAVTGFGVTYTPVLTATTLTTALGDFVGEASSLVTCSRVGNRDVRNVVALKYRRRDNLAHIYGEETVEAAVRYDAAARGLTARDEVSNGWISREAHAAAVAHLLADANVTRRTSYAFRLGPRHQALEPGDMVTLTEPVFGLSAVPCRVVETVENDGYVEVVAEEWPGLPVSSLVIASRPTPMDGAQIGRDTGQTALVVGSGAQDAADTAQATANAKNRTFRQATAPTNPTGGLPLVEGDTWENSANGNAISRWSGSAWVAAPSGTPQIDAGAVDWSRISAGQGNTANLWPNPTSEVAPPTGADTTGAEWKGRTSIGDAPAGNYVRRLTTDSVYLWIPCVVGDQYLLQAVARWVSGTGSGYLGVAFYQADQSTIVGSETTSTITSAMTTFATRGPVTATAGAGAVWARFRISADSGTTCDFDQLHAYRMIEAGLLRAQSVLGTNIHGDALATVDYAEDGSGNPTAGAKMLANTTLTAWASNTAYSVGDKRANGVGKLYQCTTAGTSAGGRPSWISGTTYAAGDMVNYSNRTYYSLQAGNTNHQPDTSPTWWEDRGAVTGPSALGSGIWDGTAKWEIYSQFRVGPSGIRIGTKTMADLMAPEWVPITPNTNWTGSLGLSYMIDMVGMVHMRGQVTAGTGAGAVMFTLPAGFRPASTRNFWSPTDITAGRSYYISSAGEVRATSYGASEFYSLDMCHFPAEQ